MKSRFIAEGLAVASVISVFLISLLVSINHGGIVYLGLLYLPLFEPEISILIYIFLTVSIYYNFMAIKDKPLKLKILRVSYLIGLAFATINVGNGLYSCITQTNIDYNDLSFFIDVVLVIVGLLGESILLNGMKDVIKILSDRDVRDLILLCLSLLLLSTVRMFNNNIPVEATIPFLISSWILALFMLRRYVWRYVVESLDVRGLVFLLTANLIYLWVLVENII